jgi:hypothetical protein
VWIDGSGHLEEDVPIASAYRTVATITALLGRTRFGAIRSISPLDGDATASFAKLR